MSEPAIYLITPPFTQLNTPYPATAYLKGFLNTRNIKCFQADLGIEVILEIFSKNGLQKLFDRIAVTSAGPKSENAERMLALKEHYLQTIEAVMTYLQNKNNSLAHLIAGRSFLP